MSDGRDTERLLDRAIDEIGGSAPDPDAERRALDDVWSVVGAEAAKAAATRERDEHGPIRTCEDFQALIPAYVQGALVEARALLVRDHVNECVPCRRALKAARDAGRRTAPAPVAESRTGSRWVWRLAAAAVLFLAVVGLSVKTDLFTIRAGGVITVERVDGEAFRITEQGTVPVRAGDRIDFGDSTRLRTGKGSTAMLRLEDDSRVEVNERAELAVYDARKPWSRDRGDSVIDLDRGSIIVEASDQGSGHMYVDTDDARVAVTGTIFAVNSGVKGSRVSVIEGEVHVDHDGDTDVLQPGQQTTTDDTLGAVPVADEIAWSADREKYLALLAALTQVGREIAAEVEGPGVRYSTELLDVAPAGTVIYVGIPNIGEQLGQSYELLEQKVGENELLDAWWRDEVVASGAADQIADVMERVRRFGDHLGDEVAVTLQVDDQGNVRPPLVLARLNHPGDFRAFLDEQIADLASASGSELPVRIHESELPPADDGGEALHVWLRDGFVAVSPDTGRLAAFAASLAPHGRAAFASASFRRELATRYADGVEWIIGVDVRTLIGDEALDDDTLRRLGLVDLRHIVAERTTEGIRADNRLTLTFDQPRQGIASWLAEPAPMGSLEFIAADAGVAAGFVMREPSAMVDELFDLLRSMDDGFDDHLAEFQAQSGIDLRRDVAETLGGEFAFALEKPVLPNPSWKLIVEVYEPERLQQTLEIAVRRIDELIRAEGRKGLALETTTAGGRTWHEIRSLDLGLGVHYGFVDGYVIAGSSRTLLTRALQLRDSGITLASAPVLRQLLPADRSAHVSALVFQNLGSVAGNLPQHVATGMGADGGALLERLATAMGPSLTVAYGERDRIVFVNTSEGGLLGNSLGAFLRLDSLFDMPQWLDQISEEGATDGAAVRDCTHPGDETWRSLPAHECGHRA